MDSPTLNHVSLCAGYGGIDLGLKRAIRDLRTVAFCEIEAFAVANLVAKMEAGCLDPAPVWTNLKTFPWGKFHGLVDVLSGGYPCQPFSAAGKRLGRDDERHLWPWIADGIAAMQPRVCFFENVEGHISLGLEDVLRDFQGLGYRCTFRVFSAAEVGAPHQRKRVFILAHRLGTGLEGFAGNVEGTPRESAGSGRSVAASSLSLQLWPSRPGQPQFNWEPPRVVGDTAQHDGRKLPERCESLRSEQSSGRQAQPSLGRDADGPPGRLGDAELFVTSDNRTDELRLLGNGVVPATAERAFRVLIEQLYATHP